MTGRACWVPSFATGEVVLGFKATVAAANAAATVAVLVLPLIVPLRRLVLAPPSGSLDGGDAVDGLGRLRKFDTATLRRSLEAAAAAAAAAKDVFGRPLLAPLPELLAALAAAGAVVAALPLAGEACAVFGLVLAAVLRSSLLLPLQPPPPLPPPPPSPSPSPPPGPRASRGEPKKLLRVLSTAGGEEYPEADVGEGPGAWSSEPALGWGFLVTSTAGISGSTRSTTSAPPAAAVRVVAAMAEVGGRAGVSLSPSRPP